MPVFRCEKAEISQRQYGERGIAWGHQQLHENHKACDAGQCAEKAIADALEGFADLDLGEGHDHDADPERLFEMQRHAHAHGRGNAETHAQNVAAAARAAGQLAAQAPPALDAALFPAQQAGRRHQGPRPPRYRPGGRGTAARGPALPGRIQSTA